MISPCITKTAESLCTALTKLSNTGEAHIMPGSIVEFLHISPSTFSSVLGFTPQEAFIAEFFIIDHNEYHIPFYCLSHPTEKLEATSSTKHLTFQNTVGMGLHCAMITICACHPEQQEYSDTWAGEFHSIFPEQVKEGYMKLKNHLQSLGFGPDKKLWRICGIVDQETIDAGLEFGMELFSTLISTKKMAANPFYGPAAVYMKNMQLSRFLPGMAEELNNATHSHVHLFVKNDDATAILGGEKLAQDLFELEKDKK